MDTTVKWNGRMNFTATADSGHEVILDSDPSVGGDNQGSRPMELVLEGLAGCTAMDVISIMQKKRQNVTGFEVSAHAKRAETYPKVFTEIAIKYTFWGKNIDPKAVERSIELSEKRYCPAQAMLAQAAPITLTYEIIEE
ncbi:MAG: OsmC family protein [Chloroflexi bacterium]|nr:OsmC family protein [Chloroflexota bacterium]